MECDKLKKQLYYYHYDLLSSFEKKKMKKHLKKCIECQKVYKIIQYKTELFNVSGENEVVQEYMDKRILGAVEKEVVKKDYTIKRDTRLLSFFKIGFAAAFIVIIGFLLFQRYKQYNYLGTLTISNNIIINGNTIDSDKHINKDTHITVPKDSKATLALDDYYKIVLHEKTAFHIEKDKNIHMMINYGSVYFNIEKNKSQYIIETVNAIIKVIGTKFRVYVDNEKNITVIEMIEGHISVYNKYNSDKKFTVTKGQKIRIIKNIYPDFIEKRILKHVDNLNKNSRLREKIYLRDGNIFVGNIIQQDDNEIIIQTQTGVVRLYHKDINKIEYIK